MYIDRVICKKKTWKCKMDLNLKPPDHRLPLGHQSRNFFLQVFKVWNNFMYFL